MSAETTLRVLILFAHPALEKSRVNRRLSAAVSSLPGVTFHDLYEAYPDFDVDVRREQELLGSHDLVVLQHPFFWYSIPPLLKQWIDLVLEHGWAYGSEGKALVGKEAVVFGTLDREMSLKTTDKRIFLLGHQRRRGFALVVFDGTVAKTLDEQERFHSMYVTVRGKVTLYRGRPQMVITNAAQVSTK